MKIAYFTDTYLPTRDGVVTTILNFRRELERRGHEVYIFCSGTPKAKRENYDPRAFYHRATPFQPYPDYTIALFPFFSERKVKSLGCELVHTHGMATMGLAALRVSQALRLPCVGTFHTLIPEATHYISSNGKFRQFTRNIAWRYMKWYFNLCDVTTAPTEAIKEILIKQHFKSVDVVPNPVDTLRFNPDVSGEGVRKKFSLGNENVVLHVGRLALEKNLDVLIKAALLIQEEAGGTKFLVVGKGPAEARYRKLVEENGLSNSFIFTGFVPDEELPAYYAAADVFAFPSKFETQGLTGLEAMACGKPVAGADYLALKGIVREGYNGCLFNPDNADSCAEAVVKALKEKGKLRNGALETAQAYSIPACADRLLKVYEKLLAL